jgi:hypothetical protein
VLLFAANKNKSAERVVENVILMMCCVMVGLYNLNAVQLTHSLKAPGFKPWSLSREKPLSSLRSECVNLYRCVMEEAIASMPVGMDKFSLILFAPYGRGAGCTS